jgi:hypothetical protein
MSKCALNRAILVFMLLAAALVVAAAPQRSASAATCQPALRGVSLSPTSVPGGAPLAVTATLSCDTPKALTISLKGFTGVTVPSALHVAKGKNSASGTIRTLTTRSTRRGTIAATLGRTRKTATLTVTPTPKTCKTPALSAFSLPSLAYVGDHPALTVHLTCAAATTVHIALKSSNSYLPVPSTVSIAQYYAAATVALTPKAYEGGQYAATVSVHYGTKTLTHLTTIDPGLQLVQIATDNTEPDAINLNVLFTGIIPAGGLTVKLSSSNAAVMVPATYSFPAPSLGGGVTGVTVKAVTKNTKVTLSATLGSRTLSASTVLLPPWNSSDTVTLTPQNGPGDLYGLEFDLEYYVTLSNPAPSSGETVTFSAGSPSIELQSTTDYITPGFTQGYVEINTANVTSPVHTKIVATVDGVTTSLPVTIEPGLASFTLPATIVGGQSATGAVTLAGPVDTATTVYLQSTWGILTVPGSVTIQKGQSSATFPISTVSVSSDSQVSIVATLGSSTLQSGNIDVTP